jgi:hypothetical protein
VCLLESGGYLDGGKVNMNASLNGNPMRIMSDILKDIKQLRQSLMDTYLKCVGNKVKNPKDLNVPLTESTDYSVFSKVPEYSKQPVFNIQGYQNNPYYKEIKNLSKFVNSLDVMKFSEVNRMNISQIYLNIISDM